MKWKLQLSPSPLSPPNRNRQKDAGFEVSAVVDGRRGVFGPQGALEAASMELLSQSGAGDVNAVTRLLLASGEYNGYATDSVEYWATSSSVRSFTRTAHSFAGSALLASLAFIFSLACSLTYSRARGKERFLSTI